MILILNYDIILLCTNYIYKDDLGEEIVLHQLVNDALKSLPM